MAQGQNLRVKAMALGYAVYDAACGATAGATVSFVSYEPPLMNSHFGTGCLQAGSLPLGLGHSIRNLGHTGLGIQY